MNWDGQAGRYPRSVSARGRSAADWGQVDDKDLAGGARAVRSNWASTSSTRRMCTAMAAANGWWRRSKRRRKDRIYVATKAGRRLDPHTAEGYNRKNLEAFVERSLKNLQTEALDLLQLHCPPTEVYYRPEVFGVLDELVQEGKLRFYGVSVEKVEEALKAIEYPNVQTVQIIFNIFRQRPAELFFEEAKRRKVGILARVPLASGLLTGKLRRDSKFREDDHRLFNRHGE